MIQVDLDSCWLYLIRPKVIIRQLVAPTARNQYDKRIGQDRIMPVRFLCSWVERDKREVGQWQGIIPVCHYILHNLDYQEDLSYPADPAWDNHNELVSSSIGTHRSGLEGIGWLKGSVLDLQPWQPGFESQSWLASVGSYELLTKTTFNIRWSVDTDLAVMLHAKP